MAMRQAKQQVGFINPVVRGRFLYLPLAERWEQLTIFPFHYLLLLLLLSLLFAEGQNMLCYRNLGRLRTTR